MLVALIVRGGYFFLGGNKDKRIKICYFLWLLVSHNVFFEA